MTSEEAIDILYRMDSMVWRSGERGIEAVEMAVDAIRKVYGSWWLIHCDKIVDAAANYADDFDDQDREEIEAAFLAGADFVKDILMK